MHDFGEWRNVTETLLVSSLGYIKKRHLRHGWINPYIPEASTGDRRKFMHEGTIYFLARLVCTMFHGPPASARITVDHINRDCLDDRADNLRWATKSEQAQNRGWTTDRRTPDAVQSSLPGEVWITTSSGKRRISNRGRAQFMNSASTTRWNPITTPRPCRGQKYATIKNESFHRLVATLFIGPPPFEGATVDHINNNCTDNRAVNLRWVTRSVQNENKGRRMMSSCVSIPVELYCRETSTWTLYPSCVAAARDMTTQHNRTFYSKCMKRHATNKTAYRGILVRFPRAQVEPRVREPALDSRRFQRGNQELGEPLRGTTGVSWVAHNGRAKGAFMFASLL